MNAGDIEKDEPAPPAFAGAGAIVPKRPMEDPAFFERVPMLRCFADTLHRGLRQQKQVYKGDGLFYVAEAGSYRGRGLLAMLQAAASIDVKVHITGLDSFEGFPPFSGRDVAEAPPGASWLKNRVFADTTRREVEAFIGPDHAGSYALVEGYFNQSLPTLPERKYLFVMIDCDLYSSHLECMGYFYERLLPGGVMFFDDYHSAHYPMAKSAIDEFMADKSENLFHLGFAGSADNSQKAFFIKEGSGR